MVFPPFISLYSKSEQNTDAFKNPLVSFLNLYLETLPLEIRRNIKSYSLYNFQLRIFIGKTLYFILIITKAKQKISY